MELKNLKQYLGKYVEYILNKDIDHSGRTKLLFARKSICEDIRRRQLLLGGEYIYYKDIYGIKIIESDNIEGIKNEFK